jgi:hypothetical protein
MKTRIFKNLIVDELQKIRLEGIISTLGNIAQQMGEGSGELLDAQCHVRIALDALRRT